MDFDGRPWAVSKLNQGGPLTKAAYQNSAGPFLSRSRLCKTGHCEIQIRPLGPELGQYPPHISPIDM
jgi:hypothetical protein